MTKWRPVKPENPQESAASPPCRARNPPRGQWFPLVAGVFYPPLAEAQWSCYVLTASCHLPLELPYLCGTGPSLKPPKGACAQACSRCWNGIDIVDGFSTFFVMMSLLRSIQLVLFARDPGLLPCYFLPPIGPYRGEGKGYTAGGIHSSGFQPSVKHPPARRLVCLASMPPLQAHMTAWLKGERPISCSF